MPSTDNSGSSSPLASIGRSLRSRRREHSLSHFHSHSIDSSHEPTALDSELESFQQQVADRFQDLSAVSAEELLSISWIRKLLSMFVECLDDFRVILLKNKGQASKSPLDRFIDEFFERSVKALDICNAARDAVEKIRMWQKHLDIVLSALENRNRALSEGQIRRARKALMDLALMMLDEKDSGSIFSHRNRSFGRHHTKKDQQQHQSLSGHARSLSWSVSNSWSAAKQLQSISNSLIPPRSSDVTATNGLAIPIFTISSVLMFVLWALVAAIPCQDRGLNVHFTVPRNFPWGTPFLSLYNRILDESKKRENRNANGLLKEICQVEKSSRHMTDLVDAVQFPLTEELRMEMEQGVQELTVVCDSFKNELDPLERQIREVFRKIMSCRPEGLDIVSKQNDIE